MEEKIFDTIYFSILNLLFGCTDVSFCEIVKKCQITTFEGSL